jgi:hypothetical protein
VEHPPERGLGEVAGDKQHPAGRLGSGAVCSGVRSFSARGIHCPAAPLPR